MFDVVNSIFNIYSTKTVSSSNFLTEKPKRTVTDIHINFFLKICGRIQAQLSNLLHYEHLIHMIIVELKGPLYNKTDIFSLIFCLFIEKDS